MTNFRRLWLVVIRAKKRILPSGSCLRATLQVAEPLNGNDQPRDWETVKGSNVVVVCKAARHWWRLHGIGFGMLAALVAGGCSKEPPTRDNPLAKSDAEATLDFEATKEKANQGDPAAQNLLGEFYLKGQGIRQDSKAAAECFRKSADQGNASAEFNLGTLHEAGQGVPFDYARAIEWYRKSAEHGHAAAQYSLAVMYVHARGVARNDAEAFKWLRRAAEQGEPMAAFAMGERCRNGTGVPQDLVEAYKWFNVAAEQQVSDAATALKEIKAKMTSEQVAEGRKRMQQLTSKNTSSNPPK
jgi:hypothetical protein